jgi:Calx-beta domain
MSLVPSDAAPPEPRAAGRRPRPRLRRLGAALLTGAASLTLLAPAFTGIAHAATGDLLPVLTPTPALTPIPSVSIADAQTLPEGDTGTHDVQFLVTVTRLTSPLTVAYASSDGSARIADNDYLSVQGELRFVPGSDLTRPISVSVVGDRKIEPDEDFSVSLRVVEGRANVVRGRAKAVIKDDDTPALSVTNHRVIEPLSGSVVDKVKIRLSKALAAGQTASVHFRTADGTARTADGDYNGVDTTVSLTSADGTDHDVDVTILDDGLDGAVLETFQVILDNPVNATISQGQATVEIADADFVIDPCELNPHLPQCERPGPL